MNSKKAAVRAAIVQEHHSERIRKWSKFAVALPAESS